MKPYDLQISRLIAPRIGQLLILSFLFLGTLPALADDAQSDPGQHPFVEAPSPFQTLAPLAEGRGARLQLDLTAYSSLKTLREVLLKDFVLEVGRTVDLHLQKFTVFGSDCQFVAGTADGDKPLPPPDVVFFRGKVRDVEDSRVFLALSPHGNAGYIKLPAETFVLLSEWRKPDPQGGANQSIVVEQGSIPARFLDDPLVCRVMPAGVGLGPGAVRPELPPPGGERDGGHSRIADVALDADYGFYQLMGNNQSTAMTYILTLLAGSSDIWGRDVDLWLSLTFARVWSVPDPLGDSLEEFTDYWNDNMTFVQRNHVHKITNNLPPPGTLGIAWISCDLSSLLCDTDWCYSITQADNTLSAGEFRTFCQELGHNVGSPHTHCYNPQIDRCYRRETFCERDCYRGLVIPTLGTIMSYCSSYILLFHSRVRDHLRANILNNGCLTVGWNPVYVDFLNFADPFENGSVAHPWNTVREGLNAVVPGGTIFIAPENYAENITAADAVTLRRWDIRSGIVRIGQ